MYYSIQLQPLERNCGHNHETVEAALQCRKVLTELSNKALLKGARLRMMWERAVVIDNTTNVVVLTPEWNPVSCRKCGKIEPCPKHKAGPISISGSRRPRL